MVAIFAKDTTPKNRSRQADRFLTGRGLCPVTGEDNNWSYTEGGLYCVYGDHSTVWGWKEVGTTGNGGMLYVRDEERDQAPFRHEVRRFASRQASSVTLQSAEVRDAVYRALLTICMLSPYHRRKIERRGITGVFDRLDFGTLPVGKAARSRVVVELLKKTGFTREQLAGVPGFYLDEDELLQMVDLAGILIPYYDVEGQISGFQVRSDRTGKGCRYRWFSSGSKGVSSGTPIGYLAGNPNGRRIVITEGAFKAAAILANYADVKAVFYLAGVGTTKGLVEAISEITRSGSRSQDRDLEIVEVMFDSDALWKVEVLGALGRLIRLLQDDGYTVEVKSWEISKGKGIDDYLANGHRIEDIHTLDTDGILRGAALRKQSRHLTSSVSKGSREVPIMPDPREVLREHQRKEPTVAEMRRATRAAFVEAIKSLMGTFVLLDGATGSGKTKAFVEEALEGTVYAANNYKKMFEVLAALEEEGRSHRALFGRGRKVNSEADAETRARQQVIWKQAGCEYIERAEMLGSRGYFPCTGCPLFKTDPKERAESCRYWKQRQEAVEAQGSEIVVTLAQTLASNHEFKLNAQGELFEAAKAHTLIFDDIAEPWGVFAPIQKLDLDDVAKWAQWMPSRDSLEEKERDQVYRDFVEELRLCLASEERSLEPLYEAATRANKALEEEGVYWEIFRVKHEEEPPVNAFTPLVRWLARGLRLKFFETGNDRALGFLRPSPLLGEMAKGRVIWLDATPNKELMKHFAEWVGMACVDTKLPQPTQNIIQIVDRLWTGEQLDNHPEAAGLIDYAERKGGLIIRKKARAQGGEAYFGRDERGLNAYKGVPFTVLEGHHMMRGTDAEAGAWVWKACAEYFGREAPFAGAKPLPEKMTRTYGDSWRRWTREQSTLSDPLAESIRKHHYSTTILQAVARDRDPKKPKYVLSGSVIELNGKPYPVKVWTVKELRAFLEREGVEIGESKACISVNFNSINKKRKATKQKRIEEELARLEELGGFDVLPRSTDVRLALGGKNVVDGSFAREVWMALQDRYKYEQLQWFRSRTQMGRDGEIYNPILSVSPSSSSRLNSMETKENDFVEACLSPSLPPPSVALCVPLPREEEQEDICTGIFTRETERSPDIPPPDLPSEREVAEGREEGEEKAGLDGLFEDEVCVEIHSPLPRGEEAANPPPSEGEKEGAGEERRESVVWSWWMWLGGVEVWRAWEDDPSEANCSVLDALLCEMRRHVPEYRRLEILDVLNERMDRLL